MSERDNHRRWDGRPGHYEVWYVTGNHHPTSTGYWIRYTMDAPLPGHGTPYAQVWFAHFDAITPDRNFGINRILPIEEMTTAEAPFSLSLGNTRLTHESARGSVAGAGHEASWDLSWKPAAETHRHLPGLMYRRGGLGETTVLSPSVSTAISGTITADGRQFDLQGEPGCQTHLWGKKHAYSWAWGHCNAFAGHPTATLEALTVRLKRRGVTLPQLTIFTLYLDGQVFRMTEFHHTLTNRARYGIGHFSFSGTSPKVRIEGEFRCRIEDMIVAPYADPDGEPSFCANTEVADLSIVVYRRKGLTGWHEQARLLSRHGAHFEVAGRTRDPGVAKEHVSLRRE